MIARGSAGLVCAGGVTQSFLARMPALLECLGPVKANSLPVSRRIANRLRAGKGVADYAALENCKLILIAVPEPQLDRVSDNLAANLRLEGKAIVLCDMLRDSFWPTRLRTAHAKVASLNAVPGFNEQTFVAEGHPGAVAILRRTLARERRRLIELEPSMKPLYLSGVHVAAHLLLPWIAGALESFRAAGFSREQAAETVQALGARALKSYARAGGKAWNRTETEQFREAIGPHLAMLRRTDPRLAILFGDDYERLYRVFDPPAKQPETRKGFGIETGFAPRLRRARAGIG